MGTDRKIAAIVYDFDGTLARGNVQEHSFIPEFLDTNKEAFWKGVKSEAKAHDADEILVYMRQMLELAKSKGKDVTRGALAQHGRTTPLFKGVDTWFDRINQHALENEGLDLEHYIISSGIYEMLEGCSIHKYIKRVFASKFLYHGGVAVWPAVAVNYTTKTQFLFRINKGISTTYDNESINKWTPMEKRPVPFTRMIFIGDGDTDIPAMKMVRHQGGHSVAVFDPDKWTEAEARGRIHRLISEDRVHFVAPADYSENSQLDVTVKGILGRYSNSLPPTR